MLKTTIYLFKRHATCHVIKSLQIQQKILTTVNNSKNKKQNSPEQIGYSVKTNRSPNAITIKLKSNPFLIFQIDQFLVNCFFN